MEALARAHREEWGRIVATLIRVTGDWTLAEDSAQDALAAALQRWPRDGVPGNPGGWLMTVARNRAIDVLRRAKVEQRKLRDVFTELSRRGCRCMLSNSDVPFVRDLYAAFRIDVVAAPRAINCDATRRGLVSEVVVRNYA